MRKLFLQNATEVYYKMRLMFYYKMHQLLQNATFVRNIDIAHIKAEKISWNI